MSNSFKHYCWEIYTLNAKTLEGGWDIKHRSVIAESMDRAREILKSTPLFDCVILNELSGAPTDVERECVWDNLWSGTKGWDSPAAPPFLVFAAPAEQAIVNPGDVCPIARDDLELYTPHGFDGHSHKWTAVNGEWQHTADGDYRRDANTGRFRKLPRYAPMNGYTRTEYNNWLKRSGFAT